ncbi:MAG: WD40 repeat domain-containing serine/threonine protein kinase [Vulcanimicrobiota bacterium]
MGLVVATLILVALAGLWLSTGKPGPAATLEPEQSVDLTGTAGDLSLDLARQTSVAGPPPSLPGYRLEGLLGRGAFGQVYRGVQQSTGQPVAIKVLSGRPEALTQWQREVERLSRVSEHPNIVTLLDARLDHEPPYLVTPLLSASLEERVPEADIEQVVLWFWQIAQALQAVHGRGILHCDLKPSNILLGEEGQARVVDFGKAVELEGDAVRLGTFWYMPPEQAQLPSESVQAPDVAWDVYALGATIYRLLTGRPPRADQQARARLGETEPAHEKMALYRSLLKASELVSVTRFNPQVDRCLAAIVERCLELSPERRYAGMGELLEDLWRRRERLPVRALPATKGYVLERYLSRNRKAVSVAMVALLVLTAGSALAARRVYQARREARQQLAQSQFDRGKALVEQGRSSGLVWMVRALESEPEPEYRRSLARELGSLPYLAGPDLYRRACNPSPSPSGTYTLIRNPADRTQRLVLDLVSGKTSPLPAEFGPLDWDQRDKIRYQLEGVLLDPQHGRGGPATWNESVSVSASPLDQTRLMSLMIRPDRILRAERETTGRLLVRDRTGRIVFEPRLHPAQISAPVLSREGDLAVGWDNDPVDLYRRQDGYRRVSLSPMLRGELLRFSPDCSRLAVHDGDRQLKVWQTNGPLLAEVEVGRTLNDMNFSPDGQLLVCVTRDGLMRGYNLSSGQPAWPAVETEDQAQWVYVQPQGDLVSMSDTVTVWRKPRPPAAWDEDAPASLWRLRVTGVTGWVFDDTARIRMLDHDEFAGWWQQWRAAENDHAKSCGYRSPWAASIEK